MKNEIHPIKILNIVCMVNCVGFGAFICLYLLETKFSGTTLKSKFYSNVTY